MLMTIPAFKSSPRPGATRDRFRKSEVDGTTELDYEAKPRLMFQGAGAPPEGDQYFVN